MGVCSSWVAACCDAGIVRLFHCRSLAFKATLPRVVAKANEHTMVSSETGEARYAKEVAVVNSMCLGDVMGVECLKICSPRLWYFILCIQVMESIWTAWVPVLLFT